MTVKKKCSIHHEKMSCFERQVTSNELLLYQRRHGTASNWQHIGNRWVTHFLESTRVDRSGHWNSPAAEEKIIAITNGEGSGAAQHPPNHPPAGETPWKLGFILPQVVDPNRRHLVLAKLSNSNFKPKTLQSVRTG
jgi:hypothetical protein